MTNPFPTKKDLTTGQVAKLLGLSHRTAAKIIDRGWLLHWKVPGGKDRRVKPDDLVRFAKEHDIPLQGDPFALRG